MRKVLTILAYAILIAANIFIVRYKLDEAYSAGYEAGYEALDLEQRENRKTYIDGYVKGLAEGKETGMATVKSALENPDSLSSEILFNRLDIDYEISDDDRYIEDMIQDEVFERTHRIMEENEELRELLEEYDIGYDY